MSDNKTLEEILLNKQMRDKIYSLMILNEQQGIVFNESFIVTDPTFPTNSGLYIANGGKYYKYIDEYFREINLKDYADWKDTTTKLNKMREMD